MFDRCWNDVRNILMASPEPLTLPAVHRRAGQYSFVYVQDILRAMRVRGVVERTYHGPGGPGRTVTYEWTGPSVGAERER